MKMVSLARIQSEIIIQLLHNCVYVNKSHHACACECVCLCVRCCGSYQAAFIRVAVNELIDHSKSSLPACWKCASLTSGIIDVNEVQVKNTSG